MTELQLLRADHADALLAFEAENRAYFARTISDRGDDYFTGFDARHAALLAEQEAGTCLFHVLVEGDGQVLGRFNLVDVEDGTAELGFRVAEKAAGRGVATAAVHEICVRATEEYGLTRLTAAATVRNIGSRTVLTRTGFVPVSETELAGEPATSYVRVLRDR
ncbi:GNAT family N-acetyltransferase [Streptomyces sp. NPDC001941]|uniref:GNAT family N-acetyltransferase n=1 Tax=Streptomyces sp. NPDC001941 TaxID=3154659 RepID=UPI00331B2943